jgi:hypothetical protein
LALSIESRQFEIDFKNKKLSSEIHFLKDSPWMERTFGVGPPSCFLQGGIPLLATLSQEYNVGFQIDFEVGSLLFADSRSNTEARYLQIF